MASRGPRRQLLATLIAVAALLAGMSAPATQTTQAHETPGYSHDSSTGATNTDWMANIPGDRPLSQLSIPGTHDSGASENGGDIGLTQSMSIATQLDAGIRALDIRLGTLNGDCEGPDLWILHGVTCQEQKFTDVVEDVRRFLAAHETETVLMRIARESTSTTDDIEAGVRAVLFDNLKPKEFVYDWAKEEEATRYDNPPLSAIRGKIVVLHNFAATRRIGILWSDLNKQDAYNLAHNWELATKWDGSGSQYCAVNTGLPNRCNNVVYQFNQTMNGSPHQIYVNFLSAASGGFPYFFASGHLGNATDAERLWTGWTRGGGILDCSANDLCLGRESYPGLECLLGTCVYFEGLNILTMNHLRNANQLTRTGIVYADFPGSGLIDAIIAVNHRIPDNEPPNAYAFSLPEPNASAWFNHDVTVTWNWADPPESSGIDRAACPPTSTSTGEGEIEITGSCRDLAGNVGTMSVTIRVDKTAPRSSPTLPAANQNGWYNADVPVIWNWVDPAVGSGLDTGACPPSTTSSAEGPFVFVVATCTDMAGNVGSGSVLVKVDKSPPIVTVPANITTANDPGQPTAVVNYAASATDNVGSATVICTPPPGTAFPLGTTSVSCTATDPAGNAATKTFTVTVGRVDLRIAKSHTGNFRRGQIGTWTISVSNEGTVATTVQVRVEDQLPPGMIAVGVDAPGWSCTSFLVNVRCTRSDALAPNATYPSITLSATPSGITRPEVTNVATVSGGGDDGTEGNVASDTANVTN